ncbi:MAG: phage major capsid protein [Candidatus Nanopelagicales bacterium]
MAVTTSSFDGIWFPTDIVQRIMNEALDGTPLFDNVTRQRTSRATVSFPTADPTGFDWRGEYGEIPTVSPGDGSAVYAPAKIAGIIEMTNEAIADADGDPVGALTLAIRDSMVAKAERVCLYAPDVPNAAAPDPVVPALGSPVGGANLRESVIDALAEMYGAGGQPNVLFTSADLFAEELKRRESLAGAIPGAGDPFGDLGVKTVVVPNLDPEDAILADSRRVYAVWRGDPTIEVSDSAAWSRDSVSFRIKARLVLAIPVPTKAARLLYVGGGGS